MGRNNRVVLLTSVIHVPNPMPLIRWNGSATLPPVEDNPLLGPNPLKNFPNFFWASLILGPELPGFPFWVVVDDLVEVDPSIPPLWECELPSNPFKLSGRGGSIAAAKTDGIRGAWTSLSTNNSERCWWLVNGVAHGSMIRQEIWYVALLLGRAGVEVGRDPGL